MFKDSNDTVAREPYLSTLVDSSHLRAGQGFQSFELLVRRLSTHCSARRVLAQAKLLLPFRRRGPGLQDLGCQFISFTKYKSITV